jgi:hypothetical protein
MGIPVPRNLSPTAMFSRSNGKHGHVLTRSAVLAMYTAVKTRRVFGLSLADA